MRSKIGGVAQKLPAIIKFSSDTKTIAQNKEWMGCHVNILHHWTVQKELLVFSTGCLILVVPPLSCDIILAVTTVATLDRSELDSLILSTCATILMNMLLMRSSFLADTKKLYGGGRYKVNTITTVTVDCSALATENCQTAKPQFRLLDMNNLSLIRAKTERGNYI